MAQPLGVTLPLRIERNGYFGTNYNLVKQIKSNLKNLILTKKGERLMQPTFGCDVWKLLFEQHTDITVEDVSNVIIADVSVWMPFLEVYTVDLTNTAEDIDNNTIALTIFWRLRANPNIQDALVLTF